MSPRPKKPRNCNCPHRPPGSIIIKPAGIPSRNLDRVALELDELEAMRLCDLEGLTQAEAGIQMAVSRGTVQRLVTSGRKKTIGAILNSQLLVVPHEEEV